VRTSDHDGCDLGHHERIDAVLSHVARQVRHGRRLATTRTTREHHHPDRRSIRTTVVVIVQPTASQRGPSAERQSDLARRALTSRTVGSQDRSNSLALCIVHPRYVAQRGLLLCRNERSAALLERCRRHQQQQQANEQQHSPSTAVHSLHICDPLSLSRSLSLPSIDPATCMKRPQYHQSLLRFVV